MKLDILAFGAHPDDVELSCSGTLIKHIKAGKKVGLVDLTRGELGTRGTKEIREAEAAESTKIMGVSIRENLDMDDCFFTNDRENKMKVVQAIRKYQPEIILANAVSDRHPDHGRGAALVSEAVFLAGLLKVETMADGKKQDLWKTKVVYHYIQDRYIKPDFIVDISDFIEIKQQAIKAFKSQFYNPDSTEPETAISTKEFLDFLNSRAIDLGRSIGARYGEGFTVERTPGIQSLFDLI
jgi:N-acetylglucosamine malate deacetylase 1